jgi:hypothetical protein
VRDPLATTAGDRLHAVLDQELYFLQTLLFDFLVLGEARLRGEDPKTLLVIPMLVVEAAVFRIRV